MGFASNKKVRSGHLCLEFHPILEEQILKSASIGIKTSASRYQEINKTSGRIKTNVCILGPTTKSDTPFIVNVVTKI